MSIKIKFGTDGWRAKIAEEYTFDNLRRCAQGFAIYLLDHGHKGKNVVVGYDMRFHSENFGAAVAEVLAANGLVVYLTDGATPTPVISFSVLAKNAVGAVNITASHNPPIDNGFKVRDEHGGAIAPDGLQEIEDNIPDDVETIKRIPLKEAIEQGKVILFDASEQYIEHLKDLIDLQPLRDAGLTILVDSMWGNGSNWFTRLLGGGKTKIVEIHNHRNPIYPEMERPEPIPPNVDAGLKATVENNADVMIVMDGDADRVGMGDENGVFIDQLRVYGLLAYYLLEVRGERGPIVKTLSTTTMLNKLGKIYDVPVYETGVGFKYVAPKMLEVDAMIGGEESGGYALRGNVPDRDGILAGLYLLDMVVKLKKKPSELIDLLFSVVGPHYYDRIDTLLEGDKAEILARVKAADPKKIGGLQVTGKDATDGFKYCLEDGGWMLIRFSGTEPKVRVYTETTHEDKVQAILQDGLKIAGL
ncbi:MAG: phosphoglucomutase/phosphomannomutase family protein [Anaerolineales bacterium]|nr:phosphoglucomutase/phosphomannomutase family protein [Anaerolineales bacterium]